MLLLVALIWFKTVLAYYIDFNMGAADILQHLLMIINPIASTLLLMSIALYIRKSKPAYIVMIIVYIAETLLLYSNILYYREFNDFISINTIIDVGKVAKGLGGSAFAMAKPMDAIYFIDFLILIYLYCTKKVTMDPKPYLKLNAITVSSVAVFLLAFDLALSEMNRPQLLSRTFDRAYIVKYMGLNEFLVYDGIKTAQDDQVRSTAVGTNMDPILNFTQKHYAKANPNYYGVAKGKNVIIIHLESFQQFLIDSHVKGQEVTPFLNSLYHSNDTLSFPNFFHEVGQGKTSDAETMLETGLFGLPEGSFFASLGTDNTFQAAPAILNQKQNYTSAVFHGNNGTFWNRNNVYANMGYNYFFDSSYYQKTGDSNSNYGTKDKLLFAESPKYLEQLQQPFYAKFITVTNHYPFPLPDEDNNGFQRPDTDDDSVNNYFATAHYLDSAVQEFFNYLKASGLYNNSIVILYGDHYGLSDITDSALAPLIGKNMDNWSNFDDAQLQRVPFMIHMPGLKGGIQKQYGGEIDVLPTLLHLLGINNKPYAFMGTDLLSKQHDQNVVFRNKSFITPKYTVLSGKDGKQEIYLNKTGKLIENPSQSTKNEIKKIAEVKIDQLKMSDMINNTNLLRFYTPTGFTPVDPKNYDYSSNEYQQMVNIRDSMGSNSKSMYSENGNKSTTSMYKTDAPELQSDNSPIFQVPNLKDKDKK